MPTARELLEQADALMRRNRIRTEADIPVLTEIVEQPAASEASDDDVPLLTEAVDEIEVDAAASSPLVLAAVAADQGEPSAWFGPDTVDPTRHSATGPAPDSIAVVPPATPSLDDDERWR